MKYMGSKAKVARYIVPIIQEQIERSGCETYLEPFCGGCNVIDKIEHYGLADKVQNSHRAIDDVLALYEVTKAMSEERDDLTDYIDLLGYNPKYGITGRKLRQITYMPQSYKLGCRLPDLMNGGGSCE